MKSAVSTSIKLGRAAAWLAAVSIAVAYADETRLIQLKHRTAEELIPVLQPLLRPGDAITGTDYRLIVRTSEERFRDIENVLTRIDTARRQLRITVQHQNAGDATESETALSGTVDAGDVRIRLPSTRGSGNVVVRKNGARLETRQTRVTNRGRQQQLITTLDGARAFVRIGQSVPQIEHVLVLAGRHAVLSRDVTYRDLVTGFDVVPRVQGDRIHVEITPRVATLVDPHSGIADFREYSAQVTVAPGEWIDLGAIGGQDAQLWRAILSTASASTVSQHTVRLKVE